VEPEHRCPHRGIDVDISVGTCHIGISVHATSVRPEDTLANRQNP
jgi:hypothetical protein